MAQANSGHVPARRDDQFADGGAASYILLATSAELPPNQLAGAPG
jgi:hypothetical protein